MLHSVSVGMITSHMNGFAQDVSVQAQGHRERAVDCPGDEGSLLKPAHTTGHVERIQHYQEELRKRREGDSRGKLDIDPNASLRLKKLSQNPKVGIDNPTFEGKEKTSNNTCSQDPVTGEWGRVGNNWPGRMNGGLVRVYKGNKRWENNEEKEGVVKEGDSQISPVPDGEEQSIRFNGKWNSFNQY